MSKDKVLIRFYESLLAGSFTASCKDAIKKHYLNIWCRGVKKNNEKCSRKAFEGSIFCSTHAKPFCKTVFPSGKNKGLVCGDVLKEGFQQCSRHSKKKVIVIEEEEDDNEPEVAAELIPEIKNNNVIEEAVVKKNNIARTASCIVVKDKIKTFPQPINGCRAATETDKQCGKTIRGEGIFCNGHKEASPPLFNPTIEKYLSKCSWIRGNFWKELIANYNWQERANITQTTGLAEADLSRDNDSIIDSDEALPRARHSICLYTNNELCTDKRVVTACGEPVFEGLHVCKKHKKFESKMYGRRILDPEDCRSHVALPHPSFLGGYWQFKRLGLFAHLTKNGLVAVGKLWNGTYAEQLDLCKVDRHMCYKSESSEEKFVIHEYGGHSFLKTEEFEKHKKRFVFDNDPTEDEDEESLILRCHNNGLLYKIVPQEYLLHQYDIVDLDSLPGKGFVSFEQMIRDRPSLYIKYWNVWNEHIVRAKEWLTFKHKTPLQVWEETGISSWINWEYIEKELPDYGVYNIIIPAPELEQVKNVNFNPFNYCDSWVKNNCPEKEHMPHFPPMYILYPFPDDEYQQERKLKMTADIKEIALRNPKLFEHYNFSVITENPYTFMQALKYGNPNIFPFTSSDVPYRLWDRIGYKKWSERFN